MGWVDQPIGTGYSIGTSKAIAQAEIAQNFVDFFKNWEKPFDIKNFKIYITGENYVGRYVPYISAAMLHQNDKKYFDLSGVLAFNPCISQSGYTRKVFVVPFVGTNANIFNFNESFMAEIQALHFPPNGVNGPYSLTTPVKQTATSSTSSTRPLSTLTPVSTSAKLPRCVGLPRLPHRTRLRVRKC